MKQGMRAAQRCPACLFNARRSAGSAWRCGFGDVDVAVEGIDFDDGGEEGGLVLTAAAVDHVAGLHHLAAHAAGDGGGDAGPLKIELGGFHRSLGGGEGGLSLLDVCFGGVVVFFTDRAGFLDFIEPVERGLAEVKLGLCPRDVGELTVHVRLKGAVVDDVEDVALVDEGAFLEAGFDDEATDTCDYVGHVGGREEAALFVKLDHLMSHGVGNGDAGRLG